MSNVPGIIIAGGSGRMGRMLIELVQASERVKLIGVSERKGHEWVGLDLGKALGGPTTGITVVDSIQDLLSDGHAVIDFSSPNATVEHTRLASQGGVAHVIGTTGLSSENLRLVRAASRHIPIVRAGNMSLGVNLLVKLTERVAAALDEDFDIEIVESHHRNKVDAPSGTALMLGESAALGRGLELETASERGRDGITGKRVKGKIGFASIRGGDVVGEHDVIFAADGERIVLRHVATDRAIFARGALKAALWAVGKEPGEYNMLDVLDL